MHIYSISTVLLYVLFGICIIFYNTDCYILLCMTHFFGKNISFKFKFEFDLISMKLYTNINVYE